MANGNWQQGAGNHQDWQNLANQYHGQYGDWYHGGCGGGWYPGAGWHNMWDNYPAAAALGVTAWGVNRLAYGFGYASYYNPYYTAGGGGYDYSQPLVSYSESAPAQSQDGASASGSPDQSSSGNSSNSGVSQAGMQAFNDARTAFYGGDSEKALSFVEVALQTMPRDTVLHEFRSLVLFSLKRYPESAAAIYAVLSAGPGWDWTTMIGLYGSADRYTEQLRALEAFARQNPKSSDAHFLLGYHYLTGTHPEAANKEFELAAEILPNDPLLPQLVKMTTPPGDAGKGAGPLPEIDPAGVPSADALTIDKVAGTWNASSNGSTFQMELANDGHFVWTFTKDGKPQTLKGAYAVNKDSLALEPDAGGTMLAQVSFVNPDEFLFTMVGSDPKQPGLDFKK
jgi:tetratricopeptide (TPR) repeat protein